MNNTNIYTDGRWGHLPGHITIDTHGQDVFPGQPASNIIDKRGQPAGTTVLVTKSGWSIVFYHGTGLFDICNNSEVVVRGCLIMSAVEIDVDHFIYFDGVNIRVIVVKWTDDEFRSDYSGFVSGCKTPKYKKYCIYYSSISDIAGIIDGRFVVVLKKPYQPDVFDMKTGLFCLFESEDDRIKGDISYAKYTPISDRQFSIELASEAVHIFKINEVDERMTLTRVNDPQIKFAGKKA